MSEPDEGERIDSGQHKPGVMHVSTATTAATSQLAADAPGREMPVEGPPPPLGEEGISSESRRDPADEILNRNSQGNPDPAAQEAGDHQAWAEQAPQADVNQTAAPTEYDNPHEADTTGTPNPEPSDPSPAAPELAELVRTLTNLEERLDESQRLLARQSDLANKLHAENQRLRAGELRTATLPLVRDLLRLHDDIGKLTAGQDETRDLALVKVSLLDALARNGISTYQPELGEQFDPKKHSVAGILTTADASRDRTVAEIVKVGIQWEDGQTIRVADVRVYKHTPEAGATSPAGQSADQPNGDN